MSTTREAELVCEAFRDLLAGRFDSDAVHEIMQRRAGSMEDYRAARGLREAVQRVVKHSGVA